MNLKISVNSVFLYFLNPYFCNPADVAKLADALDLGSSAARHVGSTPIIRTNTVFKKVIKLQVWVVIKTFPCLLLYSFKYL